MKMVLAILAVITGLIWLFRSGGVPAKYRQRECAGRKWKERFPSVSADYIRKFLSVFCNAFAFSEKYRLKFVPQDKIFDIYRAVYSGESEADCLELETLQLNMNEEYGINLKDIWCDEMTLGDLFNCVLEAGRQIGNS